MFSNKNCGPLTPPRISEKPLSRTLLEENQSEGNKQSIVLSEAPFIQASEKIPLNSNEPHTPPSSTAGYRSLLQDIQDEHFQVGLVQFINAHDRSKVSYNAVIIDTRCESYRDLIRSLYEASCPEPGARWGIASIEVLWELPVSMTTVESGNYRATPFRGMQGPALRNILRLMTARGWRDIFVVKYIEG